ncbi:hypothetical protein Pelo_3484 [Pelomyxa schiedti]|nr:hypothetical protein Pelo_3484 [Pelomyxa schiedti]
MFFRVLGAVFVAVVLSGEYCKGDSTILVGGVSYQGIVHIEAATGQVTIVGGLHEFKDRVLGMNFVDRKSNTYYVWTIGTGETEYQMDANTGKVLTSFLMHTGDSNWGCAAWDSQKSAVIAQRHQATDPYETTVYNLCYLDNNGTCPIFMTLPYCEAYGYNAAFDSDRRYYMGLFNLKKAPVFEEGIVVVDVQNQVVVSAAPISSAAPGWIFWDYNHQRLLYYGGDVGYISLTTGEMVHLCDLPVYDDFVTVNDAGDMMYITSGATFVAFNITTCQTQVSVTNKIWVDAMAVLSS